MGNNTDNLGTEAALMEWLDSSGFSHLRSCFASQKLDLDVLALLTDSDLREMGVIDIGDRKRVLRTIARSPGLQPREAILSERRPVTVLLCDIVNYTGTVAALDVEDRFVVLRRYYLWFEQVVARHGGAIQRFEGDGVRALFGFPTSDGVAPEQAIRASLELSRTRQEISSDLVGDIRLRVAIATGLAMVGPVHGFGTTKERSVTGDVAHYVARIEKAIPPGAVGVDADTRRAAAALFSFNSLGTFDFGHESESIPVEIWTVTGENASRSRSDITYSAMRLTPLVSREEEIALLRRRWVTVQQGNGQVVFIAGEAGIGKSRLTRDFVRGLSPPRVRVLRFYCLPTYQNSALHPITDFVSREAGISPSNDDRFRLGKLRRFFSRRGVEDAEAFHLLASFITTVPPDDSPRSRLSPEKRLERTIELLENEFVNLTRTGPVVILAEDAHWLDATSSDLVARLLSKIAHLPVLLILTYRSGEFTPPWPQCHFMTTINLARLSPDGAAEMVNHLLPRLSLNPNDVEVIIARAEGVPLLIEEICEAVTESDRSSVHFQTKQTAVSIPSVVSGSLMSRLDRLGSTKQVAQIAAVLGRQFSISLLGAITGFDDTAMSEHLKKLCGSQVIYQYEDGDPDRFEFKHSLLRDAAYDNLTISRRRTLHGQVAEILKSIYPADVAQVPETLAHHLTEAGLFHEAFQMWRQAGELSINKSANREALAHFERALDLLTHITDPVIRKGLELSALLARGAPLMMLGGHDDVSIEVNYSRALRLAEDVCASQEIFSAIVGLWRFCLATMDLSNAVLLSRRCLNHAESIGHAGMRREALLMLGACELYQGKPIMALQRYAECAEIPASDTLDSGIHDRASEPEVMTLSWKGWAMWVTGDLTKALESDSCSVRRARQLDHPYTLGFALFYSAVLLQCLGEVDRALAVAEEAIELSAQHGFSRWESGSYVLKGWALSKLGHGEGGLEEARQGLARWPGRLGLPRMQCLVAEIQVNCGMYDQALDLLSDARALCERSGAHYYMPEVHRQIGEIHLADRGDSSDKVALGYSSLMRAINLAREKGARSHELRAAVSLARLCPEQLDPIFIREGLERVLAGMSAGEEHAEVRDARGVLAQFTET